MCCPLPFIVTEKHDFIYVETRGVHTRLFADFILQQVAFCCPLTGQRLLKSPGAGDLEFAQLCCCSSLAFLSPRPFFPPTVFLLSLFIKFSLFSSADTSSFHLSCRLRLRFVCLRGKWAIEVTYSAVHSEARRKRGKKQSVRDSALAV